MMKATAKASGLGVRRQADASAGKNGNWENPAEFDAEPDFHDADEAPVPAAEREESVSNGPDDALGLYLRQMGSIPLLNREQELKLARRLETTRKRFRRAALFSWLNVAKVIDAFQRIRAGKLALDPTIEV